MIYHNWGRWLVDCPSKDCLASVKVAPGQGRVTCDCQDEMICTHGPLCGMPIPLEWPETEPIEAVLRRRPVPNRNWYPSESLENLKAENLLHGVGV